MDSPDVEIAWRNFQRNWIPLGLLGAALSLSLMFTDFRIEIPGLAFCLGFVALYAVFAYANAHSPTRRDPQVMFVLGSTAQIVLVTVLIAPLTYVAAAVDFPLRDAELQAIDCGLGFDWAGYVRYVNDHPVLASWLSCGYSMIRWPIFGIPVVLAAARRYCRLQEFTLAFTLALMATTIISVFVPAVGAYQQVDPTSFANLNPQAYFDGVRDIVPVHAGALRTLNLFGLAGIVTFPSFHAASALLYVWALWPVRWMRAIAIISNGALIASTPPDGGHYFIDVAAGLALAVAAIAAARRLHGIKTRNGELGDCPTQPVPVELVLLKADTY